MCGKESHLVSACSKFQSMAHEERWDAVIKNSLCRNCLKPGHIASKCRAPPMCKNCRNIITRFCISRQVPNRKRTKHQKVLHTQHLRDVVMRFY